MNQSFEDELASVRENLKRVYRLVFNEEYVEQVGEEQDVLELALLIRNHLKGRFDVPAYHRKRFNLVLQQMGCADFRLSEQFYAKCM